MAGHINQSYLKNWLKMDSGVEGMRNIFFADQQWGGGGGGRLVVTEKGDTEPPGVEEMDFNLGGGNASKWSFRHRRQWSKRRRS